MKTRTMLLAATLCAMPALQPVLADTPAAACLTANGQRLYNINLYHNYPLGSGCEQGDTLVRFQLEQPETQVRKLRNLLTEPGEVLLAEFGCLYQVYQLFDGNDCGVAVDILGGTYVYLRDGLSDSGEAPTTYRLDVTVAPEDDIGPGQQSVHGGPIDRHQFFTGAGDTLLVEDVIAIKDFGNFPPNSCFVGATTRFAADVTSLYAP